MSYHHRPRVLKEGFLQKKSTVLKKWRRRYLKLNGEMLCFFKKEEQTNATRPVARIFIADVLSVGQYFSKAKRKDNCFILDTKSGKTYIMNCSTKEEVDAWISIVNYAKQEFFRQEESDPVRRKSIRLKGDLKRVKLFKDPTTGIGVRIKSVNGCVFVTRIVEDGPVAETGVLRPGDQILDVDGANVGNMTIEEVSEILKAAPLLVTCTVKPANHYRYCKDESESKVRSYADIDIDATNACTGITADYEEDQCTECSDDDSTGYVTPIASDEEYDNGEPMYENTTQNATLQDGKNEDNDEDNDEENYVNMPERPRQHNELSPKPTNYLELCFDES